MAHDGLAVLVQGHAATLDFIPTKHRFELCVDDPKLLGARHVAQRALARCGPGLAARAQNDDAPSPAECEAAIGVALINLDLN